MGADELAALRRHLEPPWGSSHEGPSRFPGGVTLRRTLFRVLRPLLVQQRATDRKILEALAGLAAELEQQSLTIARQQARVEQLSDELGVAAAELAATRLLAGPGVEHPALQRPITMIRHGEQTGRRKALCSLAVGPHLQLLAAALPTYEAYAARHGYDVILATQLVDPDRPAAWSKIALARQLLHDYDELLWIDADMCFVDTSVDLADEVPADRDLALRVAFMEGRQHGMNTGLCWLRSTDWARAFLDEVWNATEFIEHPWWENAAFLHVFGYDVPFGAWNELSVPLKERPTLHDAHLHPLGVEWNISRIDPEPPTPRARHFFRLDEQDATEATRREELIGGLLELRRRLAGERLASGA
jgi:hypothetical protein